MRSGISASMPLWLERLNKRVGDLESEVLSTTESEDVLNKIRSEAAAEAAARQEEAGKLRVQRDEWQEKVAVLRAESAAIVSARASDEETLQRLQEEERSLDPRIEADRLEIAQMKDRIAEYRIAAEKVALSDEDRESVNALRTDIARLESEKQAFGDVQLQSSEEERRLLGEQEEWRNRRHKSELEISKAEVTLDNMKQRIEEAYGLTYESANELAGRTVRRFAIEQQHRNVKAEDYVARSRQSERRRGL